MRYSYGVAVVWQLPRDRFCGFEIVKSGKRLFAHCKYTENAVLLKKCTENMKHARS